MEGVERPEWSKTFITEKIGMDGSAINGFSVDSFIEKMDRAGIDHTFLNDPDAFVLDHPDLEQDESTL